MNRSVWLGVTQAEPPKVTWHPSGNAPSHIDEDVVETRYRGRSQPSLKDKYLLLSLTF